MSAAILTENLLAAMLLLAEGDADITLDEALLRLEFWQWREDRHFGISQHDMRGAFMQIQFWTADYPRREEDLDQEERLWVTSLRDWIPYMLRYHDVYCNDESEHWHEKRHRGGLYKPGEACSFRNYEMRKFFSRSESREPGGVMRFLGRLGTDREIMYRCSRPGPSS